MQTQTTLEPRRRKRTAATISNLELGEDRGRIGRPGAGGAQWGVVLEGRLEFTIGGETKHYGPGDTYFIPAGVAHSAVIHPGYVGIDVFADANRYAARRPPPGPGKTPAG